VKDADKTVLYGGCAHNGIINIQKKAEELTGGLYPALYPASNYIILHQEKEKARNSWEKWLADYSLIIPGIILVIATGMKAFETLKGALQEKIQYISTGASIEI
jgi:7,8-dihydropterin-6-yl-methyl-4-(beta-D-ribofuranosyl)aminobenzene 5'-phosphate synthase